MISIKEILFVWVTVQLGNAMSLLFDTRVDTVVSHFYFSTLTVLSLVVFIKVKRWIKPDEQGSTSSSEDNRCSELETVKPCETCVQFGMCGVAGLMRNMGCECHILNPNRTNLIFFNSKEAK